MTTQEKNAAIHAAIKLLESNGYEIGAAGDGWSTDFTNAPEDGTRVMGWDGKEQFVMFFRGKHYEPHQDKPGWFEHIYRRKPTHWRPLFDTPIQTEGARQ